MIVLFHGTVLCLCIMFLSCYLCYKVTLHRKEFCLDPLTMYWQKYLRLEETLNSMLYWSQCGDNLTTRCCCDTCKSTLMSLFIYKVCHAVVTSLGRAFESFYMIIKLFIPFYYLPQPMVEATVIDCYLVF